MGKLRIQPQTKRRVAIYFGGLDSLGIGNGQYRYVVDLVRGLHGLDLPVEFIVFGSRPEPMPEIAPIFGAGDNAWRYRWFPAASGRGSFYIDQVRLARALWRE